MSTEQSQPPSQIPPWGGPPMPQQQPYPPPPRQTSTNKTLYVIIGTVTVVAIIVVAALLIPGSPLAITRDDEEEDEHRPLTQTEAAEEFFRAYSRCDIDYMVDNSCDPLRSRFVANDFCETTSLDDVTCRSTSTDQVTCVLELSPPRRQPFEFEIFLDMDGNYVCATHQ